jgi:hypothetical protein
VHVNSLHDENWQRIHKQAARDISVLKFDDVINEIGDGSGLVVFYGLIYRICVVMTLLVFLKVLVFVDQWIQM